VPRYEYRCRECAATFEVSRPMAESALPAACPAGHGDSVRLLSTIALTGSGSTAGSGYGSAPTPPAGGCCGGACGCG
jgi:putative FmdB family regulatory protein